MTQASVVFDFDGTIALGQGPLDAYARAVGELTSPAIGASCEASVRDFSAGRSTSLDAYGAVRDAAVALGVDDATLSRAYLRSREVLATDAALVYPPDGLEAFLARLATLATIVIATNSPATGLDRALEHLGAAAHATEVHASVGKPAGLQPIIAGLCARGPVLAVGDIWDNDLAPAAALGADTALVGVGHTTAEPTLRGATLTDLYDDILDWAARASNDRTNTNRANAGNGSNDADRTNADADRANAGNGNNDADRTNAGADHANTTSHDPAPHDTAPHDTAYAER